MTAGGTGETREMRIDAGKPRAWAIPCGLPEWNSERRAGDFLQDAGALESTAHAVGGACLCRCGSIWTLRN
ncbi:MAG: hypothetical protein QM811_29000 [Pirellulales bacterium]